MDLSQQLFCAQPLISVLPIFAEMLYIRHTVINFAWEHCKHFISTFYLCVFIIEVNKIGLLFTWVSPYMLDTS